MIAGVRRGMLVIAIAWGLGCGGEPGVSRADHEALLQRLDAMDQRLDALEEARASQPAQGERPQQQGGDAVVPLAGTRPGEPTAADPPTLKVRVTAAGLELDGKILARADALARFRDVAATAPGTRLTVLADPGVPYATLVDALDLAREAGLTEIAMSARLHGEGEIEGGW